MLRRGETGREAGNAVCSEIRVSFDMGFNKARFPFHSSASHLTLGFGPKRKVSDRGQPSPGVRMDYIFEFIPIQLVDY